MALDNLTFIELTPPELDTINVAPKTISQTLRLVFECEETPK